MRTADFKSNAKPLGQAACKVKPLWWDLPQSHMWKLKVKILHAKKVVSSRYPNLSYLPLKSYATISTCQCDDQFNKKTALLCLPLCGSKTLHASVASSLMMNHQSNLIFERFSSNYQKPDPKQLQSQSQMQGKLQMITTMQSKCCFIPSQQACPFDKIPVYAIHSYLNK